MTTMEMTRQRQILDKPASISMLLRVKDDEAERSVSLMEDSEYKINSEYVSLKARRNLHITRILRWGQHSH